MKKPTLIAFGNFLLSPERRESYKANSTDLLEERLSRVNDADIANFFHDNPEKSFNLTFGEATELAKRGLKVARAGWNGSGMFAYIVPANKYPAVTAVAKSHFGEGNLVPYREYWALKTAQNDVATWAPSGSDSLAEDWMVVN